MSLANKVALITGGVTGIGWSSARRLAAAGTQTVISGIQPELEVKHKLEELERLSKKPALYIPGDLTEEDNCRTLVKGVVKEFGRLDIIHGNAGLQYVNPLDTYPTSIWNKMVALNLTANFHIMKEAFPIMKQNGFGRFIATCSIHSVGGAKFKGPYTATKHGLLGLVRAAALEYAGTGITVNAVSPGYVWTDLMEKQIPDTMRARNMSREEVINDVLLGGHPSKQFIEGDQVAAIVEFLCGDSASQVNGVNYNVDGGYLAQ